MKHVGTHWKILVVLVILLGFGQEVGVWAQQSAEELYESAILKKEAEGDLEGAVKLFSKIVADFADNRSVAAKAQLQIGLCHEKLGYEEALKAYRLVLKNYGDQEEAAAVARARLAELEARRAQPALKDHLYSRAGDGFYLEDQMLSPDGTKLLGIEFTPGQNVVYKDLITGKMEFITNYEWKNKEHGWAYEPVWSPDGKQVAFNFGRDKDNIKEVRISDLSGETQTVYICETNKEEIYSVDWFPGQRSLLALHITEGKVIRLGKLSIDDGEFESLYEIEPPHGDDLEPNADNIILADLSPDGKYVAFHERKQKITNIYILDVATNTIRTLMESPANNTQPKWSPDGRHIAFMSDRTGMGAIWAVAMNAEGSAQGQPFVVRSGTGANLKNWTERGICYTQWISMADIYVVPVDPKTGAPEGVARLIDFRPIGANSFPRWSPDGNYLVFMSRPPGSRNELNIVIYSISGDNSRIFPLPDMRPVGSMLDLRWLPDGSGISLSGLNGREPAPTVDEETRSMFILNLETELWRTLDLELKNNTDRVNWKHASHTDWMSDGQGFYLTRNGSPSGGLQPGILAKDLTTGEERYIYSPEGSAGIAFPYIRCSRDFSKMAFCNFPGRKISVLDIQSGKVLADFPGPMFPSPVSWSPDGALLMYPIREPNNTKLHVQSILDDTKKSFYVEMEFIPNSDIAVLDWSPDGTKVAFVNTYSKFDTYLLRDVIPEDKK